MLLSEKIQLNEKLHFSGTCSGILSNGAELSAVVYDGVHAPGYENHWKGARPLKGNTYTVNGAPVVCVQSGFRQGNEYNLDLWNFTLIPV